MRATATRSGILLLVLMACGEAPEEWSNGIEPAEQQSSDALAGGDVLSDSQVRRAGLFEVTAPGFTQNGCGAAVLRTSGFDGTTWLLSSAHCFVGLVGPGQCVQVATLERVLSGAREAVGAPGTGVVCVSPSFVAGPNEHDFATVRFPFGVTLEAKDGGTLQEYYRPVQGANPIVLGGGAIRAAVFGSGGSSGGEYGFDCSQNSVSDDDTYRWGSGIADSQGRGTIEIGELNSGAARVLQGDSGAPWMSALAYSRPSIHQYIDDGLLIGVNSFIECAQWIGDVDYEASSTWGDKNLNFLVSQMGDKLSVVWNTSWERQCFSNWCEYSDAAKVALTAVAVL